MAVGGAAQNPLPHPHGHTAFTTARSEET